MNISACRVCSSDGLVSVLNLGEQDLTGIFPASVREEVLRGPLELLWCRECSLVQLGATYPLDEMYGDNYGYRSGLNQSMVRHLASKARALEGAVSLRSGDTVLDVGSNDGTLLSQYSVPHLRRVGIDPTASKFEEFYAPDIEVVSAFFSADAYKRVSDRPARIITTISMFYDLEDPVAFARQVAECLAVDGVWHLEQSYMPSMLRTTSYDTICHEHLEYYSLETITSILRRAGLRIFDVRFNSVNGGSFAVSAVHDDSHFQGPTELLSWFESQERRMRLDTPAPFRAFESRVFQHRHDLIDLVRRLRAQGSRVFGLGASTKGNVLLQFCGFGPDDIEAIAEVNPDKFGKVTPGTGIPIISEAEARAAEPDYFIVLPWHFRQGIVERERTFLENGGRLIFPLPEIEIVGD